MPRKYLVDYHYNFNHLSWRQGIKWFDRRRGLALGFAAGAQAIGGACLPLLAAHLIEEIGWAGAVRAFAALQLAFCLPAVLWLVRDDPRRSPAASPWPCLATLGALALPLGLFLPLGDPAAGALPDDAQGEDIDSGAPATV